MQRTVTSNPFRTKYFAWVDIGYYRDLKTATEAPFTVHLPPNFNQSNVAVSAITKQLSRRSDRVIFHQNIVWACGGFFLARHDVMLAWTTEFMQFVEYFLSRGLMNSDQQVIYAAVSNHHPKTHLQTYFRHNKSYNAWFYLGFICKE